MTKLESLQQLADLESRKAWGMIFYNQAACAREIAESVDEHALLTERFIMLRNSPRSIEMNWDEFCALVDDVARKCANEQAEAAYNHVMFTPA
jgi:hypothetical protein